MHFQKLQQPEIALAELSRSLSAAFDEAVRSIGAIRSSAADFASSVEILQTLGAQEEDTAGQDIASFATFSEHANRAAKAAQDAASELDEEAFQSGLRSLALILHELKRNTIELAAISSLTKIAKTENPTVAARLDVFTEMLDKRSGDLRSSTSEAATLIEMIRNESGDARAALISIAAELRRISRDAGNGTRELEALRQAHVAQMERMLADSRTLGSEVQSAVGRVIGCLQFPDAFAQRISHVGVMLEALEEARPRDEKNALAALAAAQLDAMADALMGASDSAVAALDAIPDVGGADLGLGAKDASSAWLEAEGEANEVMIRTVAASRSRLDAAVALVARIVSEIDTVRETLEDSRRQNQELSISVHNASIVASRFGSSSSPLHVLAEGVKRVVGHVSLGVARIFEELTRIRRASQALEHAPLATELDTLDRIQQIAAEAAKEDAANLARAREARRQLMQSAESLAAAAADGRRRFHAARRFDATLLDIATQLRDGLPASPVTDGCDLGWIEAIYTMNEERVVHEQLFGASKPRASESPEPTSASSDEGDLDDFLL